MRIVNSSRMPALGRLVRERRQRSHGAKRSRRGPVGSLVALLAVGLLALPGYAQAEGGTAAVGWGYNWHQQLGGGFQSEIEEAPVAVVGLSSIKSMAAGWEDSFALLTSGKVKGWGTNMFGQLGDGTETNKPSPTPVLNQESHELAGVTAFATGWDQSVALLENGHVATWGDSEDGTRGNGESGVISEAIEEHERHGTPYANRWLALELTLEPTLGEPERATQVAAAGATDYALLENDEILSWGGNGGGKLGTGEEPGGTHGEPLRPETCKLATSEEAREEEPESGDAACSKVPRKVRLPALGEGVTVTEIAAGFGDAYAVLSNGKVLAWGNGSDGALGDGTVENADTPVYVDMEGVAECAAYSAARHCPVVAVSGGKRFAWALLKNGEVIGWGQNPNGQLGSESLVAGTSEVEMCKKTECSTVPKTVISATFGKATAISAGDESDAMALIGGSIYTLGKNDNGLLGVSAGAGLARKESEAIVRREPQKIEGVKPVGGIAAGIEADLAYLSEGSGLVPLVSVTPGSKTLTVSWTYKSTSEQSLKVRVIKEKGVEVKGTEGPNVLRPSTSCSEGSPCSYTFTETRHGEALTPEDEYEVRIGTAEHYRYATAVPLP